MSDREPVNTMGVFAFPNPDKDQRVIRFIDSEYHTLFTIGDGDSIVITRFDGEKLILPCTYIDDYHTRVGNSTCHICEFAEIQERNGNLYVPAAQKSSDEIGIYEIYQIPATVDIGYCFRPYAEAKGKLRATDYRCTYAGMFAKENSLEHLWAKHNGDRRPFARQMRSMMPHSQRVRNSPHFWIPTSSKQICWTMVDAAISGRRFLSISRTTRALQNAQSS